MNPVLWHSNARAKFGRAALKDGRDPGPVARRKAIRAAAGEAWRWVKAKSVDRYYVDAPKDEAFGILQKWGLGNGYQELPDVNEGQLPDSVDEVSPGEVLELTRHPLFLRRLHNAEESTPTFVRTGSQGQEAGRHQQDGTGDRWRNMIVPDATHSDAMGDPPLRQER